MIWTIAFFLFLIGFFSRYLLQLENFSSVDSVQYAIATFDYSMRNHTPPAPGYFLYIMTGKFLNLIFQDPYISMILISALYSALIASLLFFFGSMLFSYVTGFVASLLFLSSPVFWYKGITVYGYLNSGFFMLLIAFFCYRTVQGSHTSMYWATFFCAILTGIRPQELPMLLPLVLFSLYFVFPKERIKAISLFGITCLTWWIPQIMISGGVEEYWSTVKAGSSYLATNSIFGGQLTQQINNHLIRMGQYFQRSYFLGIFPLFYYVGRLFYLPNFYNNKKIQFLSVLMFPTLLFNIFIQFAEIGHGLEWGIGLFLIVAESTVIFSKDLSLLVLKYVKREDKKIHLRFLLEKGSLILFVSAILSINIYMFFYNFNFDIYNYNRMIFDDRQFNYADAKKADEHLTTKIDFIKKNFDAQKTVILSARFYTQLMYAFPDAIIVRSDQMLKRKSLNLHVCHQRKRFTLKNKTEFNIPPHISKIIIFDDTMMPFVLSKENIHDISVENRHRLLVIPIMNYKKIIFGYHSLSFF